MRTVFNPVTVWGGVTNNIIPHYDSIHPKTTVTDVTADTRLVKTISSSQLLTPG